MWEKLLLGGLVLLCDAFSKKKETKETTKSNDKDIDMKNIKEQSTVKETKFSEQVQKKLIEVGGSATISLLNGDACRIILDKDNTGFVSDKLNNYLLFYRFEVFDVIEELLKKKGGRAVKGAGRGKEDKVGYGKCGLDTVVGYIAYKYSGVELGGSTFDPVFVLAAVLDWANVARNCRGYIELI